MVFIRAWPADRRHLYTITEADEFHRALSDAPSSRPYLHLPIGPLEGLCMRNRDEGKWGSNLYSNPWWRVCVALHRYEVERTGQSSCQHFRPGLPDSEQRREMTPLKGGLTDKA